MVLSWSCSSGQSLGGVVNGGTNALIGSAATDISIHRRIDLIICGAFFSLSKAVARMIWPDWQ